jgi:hypothetical protein
MIIKRWPSHVQPPRLEITIYCWSTSPVIEGRVTVDDLRDLAAVKALSAAALPWFSFAMEHPDLTERLPCVLARPEGALRFSSGIL